MSAPIAFRASSAQPCPVCGAPSKGCSVTADGLHLCRGESRDGWKCVTRAADAAGFHHYRREDDQRHVRNGHAPAAAQPATDWGATAERFAKRMTDELRKRLADLLGLPVDALAALPLLGHLGDDLGGACFTFPEHAADGTVTALNRRYLADGSKKVMQGGKRGLSIPAGWRTRPGPVLIPEGASDVLALSACGLSAVGRPSNTGGAEVLARLLKDVNRDVIVLGENDRKPSGEWPGGEGKAVAEKLAAALDRPVKWALPPDAFKDARVWVCGLAKRAGAACDWQKIGSEVIAHLTVAAQPVAPPANLLPVSPAPPPAQLIVTALATKRVKPVKYLVPGRIPAGKLILCGGRGGSGKSTLWRAIAAALSVGRCALGLRYDNPATAKTLIVAAEDGPEDTILPGLLAEGADVNRVSILEGVQRGKVTSDFTLMPEHVELVRARLKAEPDIRLIIIDPIASFVGRAKVDDHRAAELRLVLDPLSLLAETTGVTIAMIAHLNKSTGDAVDRIAGSAAYRDAVRAAFLVCEDPEDESRRLLMPVKENLPGFQRSTIPFTQVPLGDAEANEVMTREQFRHLTGDDLPAARAQLKRVKFDAAVTVDPDATMKAKKQDGTKVQRCKEWLKTFLAKYAYPSEEISAAAKVAGFTFDNVKEAKAELKREGVINHRNDKFPGGWWSGPGMPAGWTARPEAAPHTPPSPHTPLYPLSPQTGSEEITGECGERGDKGGEGKRPPVGDGGEM